jgi:hypothetical protein
VSVHAHEQRADPLPRALRLGEAADDDLLLAHALHLQPVRRSPRAVGRVAPLRHDALEPIGRLREEALSVADDVLAVAQRVATGSTSLERALARLQRLAAQVAAVPVEQVERVVDEDGHRPAGRPAFCMAAKLVVPSGISTASSPSIQASSRTDPRERGAREAVVQSLPAASTAARSSLDPREDAIAVELHLVQPLVPGRRAIRERRELRVDRLRWRTAWRLPEIGSGARTAFHRTERLLLRSVRLPGAVAVAAISSRSRPVSTLLGARSATSSPRRAAASFSLSSSHSLPFFARAPRSFTRAHAPPSFSPAG